MKRKLLFFVFFLFVSVQAWGQQPFAITPVRLEDAIGNPVGVGPTTNANALGVVVSYEALTSGGTTVAMTATTSTVLIVGTAAQNIYISSCSAGNNHASVDTYIDLQDGQNGTVLWSFEVAHGAGRSEHVFGDHPLKVPTTGNGLFAVNETTGSSTKIFCNGFKSTKSY